MKLVYNPENPNSDDFNIFAIDMRKFYQDKNWLLKQFYEENKSADDIANACGTTPRTILLWKERFESGDYDAHEYEERKFSFCSDKLYEIIFNKRKKEWEKEKELYLISRNKIKEQKRKEKEEYEIFMNSLKVLRNILEDENEYYLCNSYDSCRLYDINNEDIVESEKYEVHYFGRFFNRFEELFNSLGLDYRILKNIIKATNSIFYDLIVNEPIYDGGAMLSKFHINRQKYLCPPDCYYYKFHKNRWGFYINRDKYGNCLRSSYNNGIIFNKDILNQVIFFFWKIK